MSLELPDSQSARLASVKYHRTDYGSGFTMDRRYDPLIRAGGGRISGIQIPRRVSVLKAKGAEVYLLNVWL